MIQSRKHTGALVRGYGESDGEWQLRLELADANDRLARAATWADEKSGQLGFVAYELDEILHEPIELVRKVR